MTLEEALNQAISHHQAGRLGEAEAFYRAILQAVPNHPDANHNLGVIAIQGGQAAASLPHFKAALDLNPDHAQYRMSYIEALIQAGRPNEARRILEEGKRRGFQGPAVNALAARLAGMPQATAKPSIDLLMALFNQGRYSEAEPIARSMTENSPRDGFVWKVLGAILINTGRKEEALVAMRKTAKLLARDAEAHNNLGVVLNELGRPAEALECFSKAIKIQPRFPESHCNLGNALKDLGRFAEAESAYRRATKSRPDFAGAHYNLGNLYKDQGRLTEAEACYRKVIAIQASPEVHYNLAEVLLKLSRFDEAETAYRQAIALKPDYAEAYCNLGLVLEKLDRLPESEESHRKAIEISGNSADAYYNLGITLRKLGRLDEATESYRHALAIEPAHLGANCNLGEALMEAGRLNEAESTFRMAIAIKPDSDFAHYNLGVALCRSGDSASGINSFRDALKLNPDHIDAHGNLIFNMDLMSGFDTPVLQAERKNWSARHADHLMKERHFANKPDPDRRLRIGYVSGDFNDHSAASGFVSLLERFDQKHFEVYAYSTSNRIDQVTESIRDSVTVWRSIHGLPDDVVADIIVKDSIDILADLSGFTSGNRLLVFARKPAPIQVSMMGYPTGTGMKAMDALFVDEVVVPREEKHFYAEEIRYLPCVIGYSSKKEYPESNELPAIASNAITFGSFNRLVKISDETFALWAQLLQVLPESRLILKGVELDDAAAQKRVLKHFAGMEDRVTLLGKTSWLEHVRAYNQVDISLDPFPHGGGVTTIESIRMGVPVLTLRYPTFAGRASASILTTLGLTDWIAESEEEYLRIAIEKSKNLAALAKLRGELRGIFDASILGDPDYYLRAAEKEYRALWREWCAKQTGAK